MRVVQRIKQSNLNIESDLKLVRLATSNKTTESSEEGFLELSRALEEALAVVERSLQE